MIDGYGYDNRMSRYMYLKPLEYIVFLVGGTDVTVSGTIIYATMFYRLCTNIYVPKKKRTKKNLRKSCGHIYTKMKVFRVVFLNNNPFSNSTEDRTYIDNLLQLNVSLFSRI